MMNIKPLLVIATVALCVVGCSKKPDAAKLNAQVENYWRPCSIVSVTPVTIEATDGKKVRFSYKVKLLKNGSDATPNECPPANSSLLAAMANEDFPKLEANAVVEFTQEQSI